MKFFKKYKFEFSIEKRVIPFETWHFLVFWPSRHRMWSVDSRCFLTVVNLNYTSGNWINSISFGGACSRFSMWSRTDFWWFLRGGYGGCTGSHTYWYFDKKIQPRNSRSEKKHAKTRISSWYGHRPGPFFGPRVSHFLPLFRTNLCS